MPLVIFVPLTLNVKLLPSFTVNAAGNTLYVGATLVSFIVTVLLVAITLKDASKRLTRNVSAPSVVKSAVAVTEKDPLLLVITTEPEAAEKSATAVVVFEIAQ